MKKNIVYIFSLTQNLENYLRNHHCESILHEEQRNNSLCKESLDFLLERLRDFVHNEYSLNPTPNDIVETSEAAIELFPSLASETDPKIVIIHSYFY